MVVYRCRQIITTTLTTKDNIPSILPNEVVHSCPRCRQITTTTLITKSFYYKLVAECPRLIACAHMPVRADTYR